MVPHPLRSRRGFTLIELLVAIGIGLVLVGLAIAFLPHLDRHKGVPNGITQLQGWLNLSKMQALRDKAPRGVRLIHDGTGKVTQLVYIEQPDPIAPGGPYVEAWAEPQAPNQIPLPAGTTASNSKVTLYNVQNLAAPIPLNWEGADIGDYFQITTSPPIVARITNITGPPTAPRSVLFLDRPVPGNENNIPLRLTSGYRVIRTPRPLSGEPALQLHKDIYIDLAYSFPCPVNPQNFPQMPALDTWNYSTAWGTVPDGTPPGPGGSNFHIDILFNSYGTVANAPTGYYGIFVRHIDRADEKAALVIYTRTGKISAITPSDGDISGPYAFARDGKNPGL
ncbi:MAG TPA: prepilin-type N-terminal cleavage/methylation domain-containing protein [Gemmataceae bacterium]|nr:prepilin-type N-terminal cleavage/methylation domain-containing protein [Gemmataceae bacterium]